MSSNIPQNVGSSIQVVEVVNSDEFDQTPDDTEAELEEAKETFKDLVKQGKQGLKLAYELVEATDDPRLIRVFSELLKNVSDVNKELVNLQKEKTSIRKIKTEKNNPSETVPGAPQVVNNSVFFGSTEELRKILKEL